MDIDERDKLKIVHEVHEKCVSIVNYKKQDGQTPIAITGGRLHIHFTISKRSRSGKGFLFKFESKCSSTLSVST